MAPSYILDAHTLIWHLEGNPRLGKQAQAIMSDPASAIVIPIIALAEAAYTVEKGRTKIPSVADLFDDVRSDPRIQIYPLSFEVLQQSQSALSVPEMRDRLIVATTLQLISLGHQTALLTKDPEIIKAALILVVW